MDRSQEEARTARPPTGGLGGPPFEFLIGHRRGHCDECWGCVRHCPARAIRVTEGRRSAIIVERCVKCGVCVTTCGNSAHAIRDDLPVVRALLSSGRPVVAVLATESAAGLYPMQLAEAERALEAHGFDAVETTALGEELVASAYEQLHGQALATLPQLRSTCAVVTEWVLRFHPALTGILAPVVPPYIAQARLVKAVWPEDTAVVYVSPCWARKDEAFDSQFGGAVDVAIGFDELKRFLAEEPARSGANDPSAASPRVRPAKRRALIDGFPRRTLAGHDMTTNEVVTIRGPEELDRLLVAVTQGETAPAVIDALFCEGCVDGPAIVNPLSVFARRSVIAADDRRRAPETVDAMELLSTLPAVDLIRSFKPRLPLAAEPTPGQVDAALAEAEMARSTAIDCGACGYDTCVEHAAAICLGNSTWEMCFPRQRDMLERERERLTEEATVDSLTGLANRRGFDARIAEEVTRAHRYAAPLSLVMLDVDGFKAVNDRHGHRSGDSVLALVAMLVRDTVRGVDVPARYGGDEFVILLPNTTKTEAFLVAEKVRRAIATACLPVDQERYVQLTSSLGVASLSESCSDPDALVRCADAALYAAKAAGRDRVELARS